jgi:hypothetical protein
MNSDISEQHHIGGRVYCMGHTCKSVDCNRLDMDTVDTGVVLTQVGLLKKSKAIELKLTWIAEGGKTNG